MRQNARSRTLIATAAALTFVLAGSTIAMADDGRAADRKGDKPDRLTDQVHRQPDWPGHRITDKMHDDPDRPADRQNDRVGDRPSDRPKDRPTDRPADKPDRHDRRSLFRRCLKAAQSDENTEHNPKFRRICHRLISKTDALERCLKWLEENTAIGEIDLEESPFGEIDDGSARLRRICHRLFWRPNAWDRCLTSLEGKADIGEINEIEDLLELWKLCHRLNHELAQ